MQLLIESLSLIHTHQLCAPVLPASNITVYHTEIHAHISNSSVQQIYMYILLPRVDGGEYATACTKYYTTCTCTWVASHVQGVVHVHAVVSECDYHAMNNIIPTHKAEPLDTKFI